MRPVSWDIVMALLNEYIFVYFVGGISVLKYFFKGRAKCCYFFSKEAWIVSMKFNGAQY